VLRLSIVILGLAAAAVAAGSISSDANPVAGKLAYDRCIGCHSPKRDRTGPRHCGLVGRVAGSVSGFDYSTAMRDSAVVWDRITLDQFLESPLSFMPGTRMGFAGIKNAAERSNLIAYLEELSGSSQYCKTTL
jgi:cytochrome c